MKKRGAIPKEWSIAYTDILVFGVFHVRANTEYKTWETQNFGWLLLKEPNAQGRRLFKY